MEIDLFLEIGDLLNSFGFFGEALKFSEIHNQNLSIGIEVQIREDSGRPLREGNECSMQ
jgi:hypothetical protein